MRATALLAFLLLGLSACVEPAPSTPAPSSPPEPAEAPRTAERASAVEEAAKEVEVDDVEFRVVVAPGVHTVEVPEGVLAMRAMPEFVEGSFTDFHVALAGCGEVAFGIGFIGVDGNIGAKTLCGKAAPGPQELRITADGQAVGSLILTALVPE